MQPFKYAKADSFESCAAALQESAPGETVVMAGGTDLLGVLKDRVLKEHPRTVIGLKNVKDAAYIRRRDGHMEIGAMTRLAELAESDELRAHAPLLAEAAYSVATPVIRNVATLGGNLCQDTRCWFYRYPHEIGDRLDCMRKGGDECYAVLGDNRYHSIFGGMKARVTPCTVHCPAGIDIPAYMERLRAGDPAGAAAIMMRANPLPMITSRVCAHFCEDGCNRKTTDQAVSIHSVERWVGDYILENAARFYAPPAAETGKKVAIVGAGPAGLTAAYFLRKAGHGVTVIDRMDEPGGMLTYAIPAYRLPRQYVQKLVDALRNMGVRFQTRTAAGKDIHAAELEAAYDKAFIATGAWKRPALGFDGEEFTEFGLDFLREVKVWVDRKPRNNVLVIGGGNVAMDVAMTAKRLGAGSVTLACLEQPWEMPATAEEVSRVVAEGIVIKNGYGVSHLIYEGEKVRGMELVACTSIFDAQHRFAPQYDRNSKLTVDCDSVLLATGQQVDLSFIEEKYKLAQEKGLIKVEAGTQKTSLDSVFAGGDAVTGPSTVVMAIRTGHNAAEAIHAELGGAAAPAAGTAILRFDPRGVQKTKAVYLGELSVSKRAIDKEDSSTIAAEESLAEASRCMNCGCYSVNPSDLSPALLALDAEIVTTKRVIDATTFFTTQLRASDVLDRDELVTAVRFAPPTGYAMKYDKFRVRKSVDFAIVSLAYLYKLADGVIEDVRLVLGGVAPVPLRRREAERVLIGKKPTTELAQQAGEAALQGSMPMKDNAYKMQIVKALINRMVAAMQAP
jgi:NADPH-dependent glutamate synthase beta subunit-like oxidoreductase/CO/xanthine dehydrogenase FAD-binding subunit